MSHDWILDVLADLKAYARKNDLRALAEQLDDAAHVAVVELAPENGRPGLTQVEGGQPADGAHAAEPRGAM